MLIVAPEHWKRNEDYHSKTANGSLKFLIGKRDYVLELLATIQPAADPKDREATNFEKFDP